MAPGEKNDEDEEEEEWGPAEYFQFGVEHCEDPSFQSFIGGIIALNALVIGCETDMPHIWVWPYFENAFLLVFLMELSLRVANHGLYDFLTDEDDWIWNCLDTLIVVGGVLDLWCLGFYALVANVTLQHNKFLSLFRMMRLLRLVKLMRQLKQIQQLYELAIAVLNATAALGWVLMLTCIFLYVFAIIFTQLIGQGQCLPEEMRMELLASQGLDEDAFDRRLRGGGGNPNAETLDPGELQAYFGSVFLTMFTLFELIAGWALQPLDPLLQKVPAFKPFFVVFWIFTSWALLSVMTGAVSEGMLESRAEENAEDAGNAMVEARKVAHKMREIALETDTNHGGTIDRQEFDALRKSHKWRDMQKMSKISPHMIVEIFDNLMEAQPKVEGTHPSVALDEFISAFVRTKGAEGNLPPVDFLQFKCAAKRTEVQLTARVEALEKRLSKLKSTILTVAENTR
mmetsp:Transcript_132063/g.300192  ORF Transcript_132063/g.300192 Transcript_132063/m.300192 type:complete len:456 (-) Transcript_132063:140-1507(-)